MATRVVAGDLYVRLPAGAACVVEAPDGRARYRIVNADGTAAGFVTETVGPVRTVDDLDAGDPGAFAES